jgi:microcompartment protein PduM
VGNVDQIIEQVMAKIRQREHQSYEVDYRLKGLPPDEEVYTDHANVVINDVAIGLVADLYRADTSNPWVQWILQGISFQVNFTFQISKQMINFIPRKMLLNWPIEFVVDARHPVFGFFGKSVSRSDLAALPDQSVVVLTPTQRLTAEAEEICQYKQIIKKIRTDEDCIWQK